jgi:hypothetical protein
LDILTEALIFAEGGRDVRIKSFGEFEAEFFGEAGNDSDKLHGNRFEIWYTLFSYFHPKINILEKINLTCWGYILIIIYLNQFINKNI